LQNLYNIRLATLERKKREDGIKDKTKDDTVVFYIHRQSMLVIESGSMDAMVRQEREGKTTFAKDHKLLTLPPRVGGIWRKPQRRDTGRSCSVW